MLFSKFPVWRGKTIFVYLILQKFCRQGLSPAQRSGRWTRNTNLQPQDTLVRVRWFHAALLRSIQRFQATRKHHYSRGTHWVPATDRAPLPRFWWAPHFLIFCVWTIVPHTSIMLMWVLLQVRRRIRLHLSIDWFPSRQPVTRLSRASWIRLFLGVCVCVCNGFHMGYFIRSISI